MFLSCPGLPLTRRSPWNTSKLERSVLTPDQSHFLGYCVLKIKLKTQDDAHRVSQEVLCVSQGRPRFRLHVVTAFVVGGGRRLRQIREVVSRPGASEADLVQAL